MSTHVFTVTGRATIEAHITIEPGGYGMPGAQRTVGYGIAFNDDADTVADTDSTGYIDYCRPEIAYHELHRLIAGRWGIESETIAAAVDEVMGECTCDPDPEDDDA